MPDTLAPPGVTCPCVRRHAPDPGDDLNSHHIRPLSWQGPDVEANRIWICPTTHARVHSVLNAYVRFRGPPPRNVLAKYPRFARDLAARGVAAVTANGGNIPSVYTSHHPAHHEGD